jgi:hypothetical protein
MIYTSRTGAAGMLLDIKLYNGKFEIVSFVVKFRLNRQSMSISMSTLILGFSKAKQIFYVVQRSQKKD